MGFGKNLKKILNEKNKTVIWLSKETEIPSTTIYSMIKRDNTPKFDVVEKIATTLEVDINDFFFDAKSLEALNELEQRHKAFEERYRNKYGENWISAMYANGEEMSEFMTEEEREIFRPIFELIDNGLSENDADAEDKPKEKRLPIHQRFLLEYLDKLNLAGKNEALKRVQELTEIPRYQKDNDPAKQD